MTRTPGHPGSRKGLADSFFQCRGNWGTPNPFTLTPGPRKPDTDSFRNYRTLISFVSPQAAMQHVREGTVRALAVTSKTRSQIFPDVPTMAEAGYPEIEGDGWVGILVPAGTPAEIIAILYRESAEILAQPDMKERLAALVASTPKEFAARIAAEIEMWAKVIRAANTKQALAAGHSITSPFREWRVPSPKISS